MKDGGGEQIQLIPNFIDGEEVPGISGLFFECVNPHNNQLLHFATRSDENDLELAVRVAARSFSTWSLVPPVERGQIIQNIAELIRDSGPELNDAIVSETGKTELDAESEISGSVRQANFWAGQGSRLGGRELPSGVAGKISLTRFEPIGIAGLIVPANTALPNITWKVFPALLTGNSVILKSSEHATKIATLFAKLAVEAGLPRGVLNVLHGFGQEIGRELVRHPDVGVISFTGSTAVGAEIAAEVGGRLGRVSLELGGNNAFIVCNDANLDSAVSWAVESAFSNAGQRCASSVRILVEKDVYSEFRDRFVAATSELRFGIDRESKIGPLISRKQLEIFGEQIRELEFRASELFVDFANTLPTSGNYVFPRVFENCSDLKWLSSEEFFGPLAVIVTFDGTAEAIDLANQGPYGLTAAVHTGSLKRAMEFTSGLRVGVVNVNRGSHGSEPHFPFGGFGASGNGTREPGEEAINVFSEIKVLSFFPN